MIRADGRITELGRNWVEVEYQRQNSCQGCASADNCGVSTIARLFTSRAQRMRVPTRDTFHLDERVQLELDESALVWAAALVYIVPLFGLLFGAVLGEFLRSLTGAGEPLTIATAFILAFAGFFSARALSQRVTLSQRFTPKLSRHPGGVIQVTPQS